MARLYTQLADLSIRRTVSQRSIFWNGKPHPTLRGASRGTRKVADGSTFADAMRVYPHVFNDSSVSMVRAGQEGGFLEDVLKRIATFTEHQEDMKGKVIGALAYPVFLGLLASSY